MCSGIESAILELVERQKLESKAVVSAGHDADTGELELEFQSGHVYRYENVPASVFAWLLRTRNKGGFVRRMITGRYVEHAVRATAPGTANGAGAAEAGSSLEDMLRASLERVTKR